MGITTDRNDPGLRTIRTDGQQESYLVLSEEERAKGYALPVRQKYIHVVCGTETRMPEACAETYAASPKFYTGTFCCACGKHFDLLKPKEGTQQFEWQFHWSHDGDPVGADAEEAQAFLAAKKQRDTVERIRHLEVTRESLLCQAQCIAEDIAKLKAALQESEPQ